jgi:hypothetical protein
MERSKTWFNDLFDRNRISFQEGERVVLFRRKSNGYPRALEENVIYRVLRKDVENLILVKDEAFESFQQNAFINSSREKEIKVHRSYVIPMNINRASLIDKILMGD